MQAIILAAGMGKRLKELTQDRTKCMVQVNGVALIDRMLHQIERRHLSRIVIVVGYEGEKLMEYIDTLGIRTPIVYVHNPYLRQDQQHLFVGPGQGLPLPGRYPAV